MTAAAIFTLRITVTNPDDYGCLIAVDHYHTVAANSAQEALTKGWTIAAEEFFNAVDYDVNLHFGSRSI